MQCCQQALIAVEEYPVVLYDTCRLQTEDRNGNGQRYQFKSLQSENVTHQSRSPVKAHFVGKITSFVPVPLLIVGLSQTYTKLWMPNLQVII